MSERDFEAEAKVDGWVPQDQYKGDPSRFISAEDFVKRGETITPILNARLRKEREKVTDLERRFEEREGIFTEFQKFQEQALTKANKERTDAIAELETLRAKAITDGDGAAFAKTDKQLTDLRAEPVAKAAPKESPAVVAWKTENPWYTTDKDLAAVADGLADVVKAETGLSGRAYLDKLTERVKALVPHKFENPRRAEQLTGEGNRKGSKQGKDFDDLPAEAKKAYGDFAKIMKGYTKEQYLSQYTWSE